MQRGWKKMAMTGFEYGMVLVRLKRIPLGKPMLAVASAAVAFLIYLFGQVACWHDSPVFMLYARHLFEPLQRLQVADRDPAYPLLIWLTGYTRAFSLHGVLMAQSIMAACAPTLVCLILEKPSARFGLLMGWLALLSAIPFAMQTELFTDELHMFLLLLLALAAVRAAFGRHPAWLYLLCIGLGLLSLCRPTFWVLLPLAAVIIWAWIKERRGKAAHCVISLLILALLFSSGLWLRELPRQQAALEGLQPVKTTFGGMQLMWNAIRYGAGIKEAYSPDDGPATREFIRRSVLAFSQCPALAGSYVKCLNIPVIIKLWRQGTLLQATASAEATFRTYFYYPRFLGISGYFAELAGNYWKTDADQTLLAHVFLEQITHHPLILARMIATGVNELVMSSYNTYNANDDYGYEPYNFAGDKIPQIEFMPALTIQNCHGETEMDAYVGYRYISPAFAKFIQQEFEIFYLPLTQSTGVLFLVAAVWYGFTLFVRQRRNLMQEAVTFFLLFAIYWLPNALMIMMTMMQFRYQACTALFPLMGTGIFLRRIGLDAVGRTTL